MTGVAHLASFVAYANEPPREVFVKPDIETETAEVSTAFRFGDVVEKSISRGRGVLSSEGVVPAITPPVLSP